MNLCNLTRPPLMPEPPIPTCGSDIPITLNYSTEFNSVSSALDGHQSIEKLRSEACCNVGTIVVTLPPQFMSG